MDSRIYRMIENSMTCRAIAVRDWLLERFAERPAWLQCELYMAARACQIDLDFWMEHQVVMEIGIKEDAFGDDFIYRLEKPLELVEDLDPAVIEAALA